MRTNILIRLLISPTGFDDFFLIFHLMPGIGFGNVEVEIEQVGFLRI